MGRSIIIRTATVIDTVRKERNWPIKPRNTSSNQGTPDNSRGIFPAYTSHISSVRQADIPDHGNLLLWATIQTVIILGSHLKNTNPSYLSPL